MHGKDRLIKASPPSNPAVDVNDALKAAGLGVWEIDPDLKVVSFDEQCQALTGLPAHQSLTFERLARCIHRNDLTRVRNTFRDVVNGRNDGGVDLTFRITGNDTSQFCWVRFWGKGYFSETGVLLRVCGVAQAWDKKEPDLQELDASQARFTNVVQQSPAATLVLYGENFLIGQINPPMLELIGHSPDVIGKPLLTIMPELQGQYAWKQAQKVYYEGIHVDHHQVLVRHKRHGALKEFYYDILYRPLIENGVITGMIQVAIDVTEQVRTRKLLDENQALLQSVVDLAELGSYSFNLTNNELTHSARLADWYGVAVRGDLDTSLGAIQESDRKRVHERIRDALNGDAQGFFQIEYTAINQKDGQRRMLRTNVQVRRDTFGKPIGINGSVIDITAQKAVLLRLEQLVQQRTEELATMNEELATINEELTTSNQEYVTLNEKLEEANSLLKFSNENLQQFAYVASHDLQEPLRKIQQFASLLRTRRQDWQGDELNYLSRMQSAAGRMSVLIKDLLDFSQISSRTKNIKQVDLNTILNQVLTDLELSIEEKQAEIKISNLPVVLGDASQLVQLFQNLLSNAIKFHKPAMHPVIFIQCRQVNAFEIPLHIKPGRPSQRYFQIDVTDQGIGFDGVYVDRIFQVFQRLHTKSTYAGTGIGLAICEKIAVNHGGAITAFSSLGNGATFSIFFPAMD